MFAVVKAYIFSFIPKQIVCFITCCILFLNMYGQNIAFNHLTVEHGLSNNSILSIVQDRQGFMWYGTNNGLNRYDGHRFRVYKTNRSDSSSISTDITPFIFFDAVDIIARIDLFDQVVLQNEQAGCCADPNSFFSILY